MASVTLYVYQVTIRKKREKDSYEPFGDFCNGTDFLAFLGKAFVEWAFQSEEEDDDDASVVDDPTDQKRFRISEYNVNPDTRMVDGFIWTGEYGTESTVVDEFGRETKKILKNESPLQPFYFLGYFPENEVTGILIFQSYRNRGGYTVFKKNLEVEFRSDFAGYKIEVEKLVSRELFEQFISEGGLKVLTFHKNNRPVTVGNKKGGPSEVLYAHDYTAEYKLIAKRNKNLPFYKRLLGYMDNEDDLDDLIPFSFEYDQITVTLKMAGRTRTMNLAGLEGVGMFFDITEEIMFDSRTGLPNTADIVKVSREYLNDLLITMGLLDVPDDESTQ